MSIVIDQVTVITPEELAAFDSPEDFWAYVESKATVSLSTLL